MFPCPSGAPRAQTLYSKGSGSKLRSGSMPRHIPYFLPSREDYITRILYPCSGNFSLLREAFKDFTKSSPLHVLPWQFPHGAWLNLTNWSVDAEGADTPCHGIFRIPYSLPSQEAYR